MNEIEGGPDGLREPTRDELLEAIHNRRRRYMIHFLQQQDDDEPTELSDVSRQVAAWERGTTPDSIGYDDRKNVHTSLYQFHCPKLAELGLIDYDCRGSMVTLTPYGENLRLNLEATPERRNHVSRYIVLPGISGLFVAAALLDVPTLAAVPDAVWTVAVFCLFVLSSVLAVSTRETDRAVVSQHPPRPVERESGF